MRGPLSVTLSHARRHSAALVRLRSDGPRVQLVLDATQVGWARPRGFGSGRSRVGVTMLGFFNSRFDREAMSLTKALNIVIKF